MVVPPEKIKYSLGWEGSIGKKRFKIVSLGCKQQPNKNLMKAVPVK